MTVTTTVYYGADGTGNKNWVYMTGTIAEVIQEIVDQGFTKRNVVEFTVDSGNAIALACRSE